jgi:muconolactone delta-isomerase
VKVTDEFHHRRRLLSGKSLRSMRSASMKIIAFDRFKAGVTMETIEPLLAEEVANCWRLWKAGVVRENYARADEPGVVVVFEVESVEEARAYVADFPMTKAGYLEWTYVPLMAPVMLESQFAAAALERASLPADRPAAAGGGR